MALDPEVAERFWGTALVPLADVEVLREPDALGADGKAVLGSGAVKVLAVGGDDWPKLPSKTPGIEAIAEVENLPVVLDLMYGDAYGPYWLLTILRACTAAFMIGVLAPDAVENAVSYVASNEEVQHMVAAAGRLGVPPLEVYMVVHERL